MKIEKISDKQIRCTLTSLDLSMRNMGPGELAYGSKKARALFTEMLQKASKEVGFEADGVPVMIEAIPLEDQSVILEITKVEDPEDLDPRFSRFSEAPEDGGNLLGNLASKLLGEIANQVNPVAPLPVQQVNPAAPIDLTGLKNGFKGAFVFANLDQAIEAAKAIQSPFECESVLYKNPETKEYYLVLSSEHPEDTLYMSTCNLLSEYGRYTVANYSGYSYYDEHYEVIIKENALEALARII